jgi:hypothetical protein
MDFPSPVLDWTESPYIAAYFAFRHAAANRPEPVTKPTELTSDNETPTPRVAIFAYSEKPQGMKSFGSDKSQINMLGPYMEAHRRHFLQRSSYTLCLQFHVDVGWCLASHEDVFRRNVPDQDVLWKFTLPSTEREKVLKRFDSYNLKRILFIYIRRILDGDSRVQDGL